MGRSGSWYLCSIYQDPLGAQIGMDAGQYPVEVSVWEMSMMEL